VKVLMFGWEFPPNNLGGLGTACYGLTKSLNAQGAEITFILPKKCPSHEHLSIISTEDLRVANTKIRMKYVDSLLAPYGTEEEYRKEYEKVSSHLMFGGGNAGDLYGKNLFEEVERYADKANIIAAFEDFDVIHCHDWMTYQAGVAAKKRSGKPLVVHVHATDFDRTGGNPNRKVYNIEREGMHAADKVVTVSNFTKEMVMKHYGIPEAKISVVHNGIDFGEVDGAADITHEDKIVLFLGRITLQKGPEYFIETAKKVHDIMPDVKFVISGSGDMYSRMVHLAADLGISKNVLFTGHLRGKDIDNAYSMASLYVMPSVSEPFGITPLEALKNNTPVLISKTSGVSEVLPNALKVDFWDTDEMTNKIVSVLSYPTLKETLTHNGVTDARRITWDKAAMKCIEIYKNLGAGA
jgi:glycogen synthase